jgi:hypothetical protein
VKNEKIAGWYINKGYFYKLNSNYLIKIPKSMNSVNGSTHVVRADLVKIPDFASKNWIDFNFFTSHGWLRNRIISEYSETLHPVDYPSLIYVVHESNISKVKREFKINLKSILKKLIRGKKITDEILKEFPLFNK